MEYTSTPVQKPVYLETEAQKLKMFVVTDNVFYSSKTSKS